jgi:hypothetical protein
MSTVAKYPNNREGWSLWYLDLAQAQQGMADTTHTYATTLSLMAKASRDMGTAIANCDDADLDSYLTKARALVNELKAKRGTWIIGESP